MCHHSNKITITPAIVSPLRTAPSFQQQFHRTIKSVITPTTIPSLHQECHHSDKSSFASATQRHSWTIYSVITQTRDSFVKCMCEAFHWHCSNKVFTFQLDTPFISRDHIAVRTSTTRWRTPLNNSSAFIFCSREANLIRSRFTNLESWRSSTILWKAPVVQNSLTLRSLGSSRPVGWVQM